MDNGYVVPLGLLYGTDDHLVRDGPGEYDHQVRRPNLLLHGPVFLCKDLGAESVAFADILVAADHTFVAADDDCAHNNLSFLVR